jgi:hypothetical protein
LVKWWHKQVILRVVGKTLHPGPWEIRSTRREVMASLLRGHEEGEIALEMLPDWPSVTAGGARFVHTVRSYLISKLPALRNLDADKWPVLQKEQYHMIKFGRFEIDPQPSPLEPVYGLCLVANPGVGPILSGNADDIDRKKIQQVTGHGATGKSVLLEYIRLNPVGGQALLERVERSHSSGKAVFGFLKKVEEYVPLLRSTL